MFTKSVIFLQILWIITQICLAAPPDHIIENYLTDGHDEYNNVPKITPSTEDITLEIGQNVTLECELNEPITWVVPSNFNPENHYNIFAISSGLTYVSILELINISYHFVNDFFCIKNTSLHIEDFKELKNHGKASSIYVFVNDPVNLLVDFGIPMISATQFDEVVIPCKPTSKLIEVELIKDEDESNHFEYNYQAAIGYTIQTNRATDGGVYLCRVKDKHNIEMHFEVSVQPRTDYISKPKIHTSANFATEGETLILNCTVDVEVAVHFLIKWILPHNDIAKHEHRVVKHDTIKTKHDTIPELSIGISQLEIHHIDKYKDEGNYICEVEDHAANKNSDYISITVLGKNQGIIELYEPNNIHQIEINANRPEVKWQVKYKAHPKPTIIWYDDTHNQEIVSSSKFDVITDHESSTLKIKYPQINDTGYYTIKTENDYVTKSLQFHLIVKDKPIVTIENVYTQTGHLATLVCFIEGYPASQIKWALTYCQITANWPNCDQPQEEEIKKNSLMIATTTTTSTMQRSELKIVPKLPGTVRCFAENTEGHGSATAFVFLSDIEHPPLQAWTSDGSEPIAAGDSLSLECAALVYHYSDQINWFRNNLPLEHNKRVKISEYSTAYSYRKLLTFENITFEDNGEYECNAMPNNGENYDVRKIDIVVHEPKSPIISRTNLNGKSVKKSLGEPVRFECVFSAIPTPQILWFKDNMVLDTQNDNESRIELFNHNTTLDIKFVRAEDEGLYKCLALNRLGQASSETNLEISNIPVISKPLIIGIVLVILVLTILTVYMCIRVRREKKLLKALKAAGLANFEEGDVDQINYEHGLDEQAELLPYDKKYEFPREKLKLGKQLGSGAFGVVVKATATGIVPYEDETTVAVKMVKKTADNEVMRALISELKIMIHLGQHLNVVNLLGAVTKNIIKREVMVIVEYCRFGNVQNFLIKHRNYFINQINRETDTIDPTILTREQRFSSDSGYEYNSKGDMGNATVHGGAHINSRGYITHSAGAHNDYFPGGMDSANTEAQLISRSPGGDERDSIILSNNSVQPVWRSNYKMDYKGPLRTITTTDLVCWSFQISRGMDYLSSRKVLHGDLAARNILLCDDNVVKICDFGLARSMYRNDNYKKKGEAPLPFKWLAIESIGDQVFSTYSDIWSFGIVMWELFSLGKVPYPGMDADQGLYFKLKDGYRMEKPEYATQELYDIMLHCWSAHAESRPLFSALEKRLSKLLESGVANLYIDLNEPYLKMNQELFTSRSVDYLVGMAPPEDLAPPIPEYINESMTLNNDLTSSSNYLQMNSIPTTDKIQGITQQNLTGSPRTRKNLNDNKKIAEEIPMLNYTTHPSSDSETEITVDKTNNNNTNNNNNNKVTGGVTTASPPIAGPRDNIRKIATDDYVNVPLTINATNSSNVCNKNAVSNPAYVTVGKMINSRT